MCCAVITHRPKWECCDSVVRCVTLFCAFSGPVSGFRFGVRSGPESGRTVRKTGKSYLMIIHTFRSGPVSGPFPVSLSVFMCNLSVCVCNLMCNLPIKL